MKNKRKICVVTGTRADYGLLTPLIEEINNDNSLELQIIATGMHLSPEFGLTYKEIEKDFTIDKKIEILLSSDSSVAVSKAMGLAQISFSEAFDELKPDIIVILGDRFEILTVATVAMIGNIPIAHISGGELTLGAIDDSIRHAITKMSHLHFVATKEYKKRVIQLGEEENKVFNFGESGLDNIFNLKLLKKDEFEKSINFKLNKRNLLFTYHPTTLDDEAKIINDFQNILNTITNLTKTNIIFTKANADAGGRIINKMIEEYVSRHANSVLFDSLGQLRYISALQFVDAVVGNTSSGIVEAPSFRIGTINIGHRQKGRIRAKSVIDCEPTEESLLSAFQLLYSKKFKNKLKTIKNPYGNGGGSFKIKEVLKNIDLSRIVYKNFKDII